MYQGNTEDLRLDSVLEGPPARRELKKKPVVFRSTGVMQRS
ncbi:MAG: hypothetical protein ACQEQO_02420 [Thermodesulfobacteriota bacterium]